ETFGLPRAGRREPELVVSNMPDHFRYWFVTADGTELLQFQPDRLLHNWRKVGDGKNEYPRFEALIEKFEKELLTLEGYFASLSPQSLKITQCEISYINHIEIENSNSAQDWLNFICFDQLDPDDFVIRFRRIISSAEGKSLGRLIYEAAV